jgi:hypothetical protein
MSQLLLEQLWFSTLIFLCRLSQKLSLFTFVLEFVLFSYGEDSLNVIICLDIGFKFLIYVICENRSDMIEFVLVIFGQRYFWTENYNSLSLFSLNLTEKIHSLFGWIFIQDLFADKLIQLHNLCVLQ